MLRKNNFFSFIKRKDIPIYEYSDVGIRNIYNNELYRWQDITKIKAFRVADAHDDWDYFFEVFVYGGKLTFSTVCLDDYKSPEKFIEGMESYLLAGNDWRQKVNKDFETYKSKDTFIKCFWERYYRNKPEIYNIKKQDSG